MSMSRKLKLILILFGFILVGIAGALTFVWVNLFSAPRIGDMKIDDVRFGDHGAVVIRLEDGITISDIAREMQEKKVIRSSAMFLTLVEKFDIGKKIKKGTYVFTEPVNLFGIVNRFKNAQYGYTPVKITIPEGYSTKDIAKLLPAKLVDISSEEFIAHASSYEGYLFPDTYYFYPYATSSDVVHLMNTTFEKKISPLAQQFEIEGTVASSSVVGVRSKEDIIILASILEKEVQTADDMALVADLFLKRIREGMPLQADSTLTYYTGKSSAQLTRADLREDTPYNSYVHKGLPPGPISNPGIKAIQAALHPEPNPYFFFLSDKNGVTHFSKTYEEHLKLKDKYLK